MVKQSDSQELIEKLQKKGHTYDEAWAIVHLNGATLPGETEPFDYEVDDETAAQLDELDEKMRRARRGDQ